MRDLANTGDCVLCIRPMSTVVFYSLDNEVKAA